MTDRKAGLDFCQEAFNEKAIECKDVTDKIIRLKNELNKLEEKKKQLDDEKYRINIAIIFLQGAQ